MFKYQFLNQSFICVPPSFPPRMPIFLSKMDVKNGNTHPNFFCFALNGTLKRALCWGIMFLGVKIEPPRGAFCIFGSFITVVGHQASFWQVTIVMGIPHCFAFAGSRGPRLLLYTAMGNYSAVYWEMLKIMIQIRPHERGASSGTKSSARPSLEDDHFRCPSPLAPGGRWYAALPTLKTLENALSRCLPFPLGGGVVASAWLWLFSLHPFIMFNLLLLRAVDLWIDT